MKGGMDVLKYEKQLSSDVEIKPYQNDDASFNSTLKVEKQAVHGKENYDMIKESCVPVYPKGAVRANSVGIKQEICDVEEEVEEVDHVENENGSLPILSVMLKEDDGNSSLYNDRIQSKTKVDLEIKYEDDIEEEDYDSDEESLSVDQSDLPELKRINNSNSSMADSNCNQLDMNRVDESSRACYDSCNFQPPLSNANVQINAQLQKNNLGEILMHDVANVVDQGRISDKSCDSILLSIVYATINVPFSQVSKFLAAYNISKPQLSIVRKVRRQVKNRLYAQNCRRRRVAHIKNLANELQQIKTEKEKLINQRSNLTAKKMMLVCHYKQLYNHVMRVLSERYQNQDHQSNNNVNVSEESQARALKRKLMEENEEILKKRKKIETQYDQLHRHVFKVIATRNHNSNFSSAVLDDDKFDFQLCHMNIANELAMLSQYYTKNQLASNESSADLESSVSVDGSRTSENKLNDFVDFESNASVDDGSRSGENNMNDFVDYESSVDGSVFGRGGGAGEIGAGGDRRSHHEDPAYGKSDDEPEQVECIAVIEENGKNENLTTAWSDNSEDDEEEDDDDDMSTDDELEAELEELEEEQEELEQRKKLIEKQFDALYRVVLQGLQISEIDFLKMFMDYCLKLLKVPGQDLCSVAFSGS